MHGTALEMKKEGSPCNRKHADDGSLCATMPPSGIGELDVVSRRGFGDCFVHLEWLSPPGGSAKDSQRNGNSGIKLMERYELQVMNTPGAPEPPRFNEAGAIYLQEAPDRNASTGAGTWQSFDVWFTAPRWETPPGAPPRKVANARMTVLWNGVLVHDDVEVPDKTGLSDPEAPARGGSSCKAMRATRRGPCDSGTCGWRRERQCRPFLQRSDAAGFGTAGVARVRAGSTFVRMSIRAPLRGRAVRHAGHALLILAMAASGTAIAGDSPGAVVFGGIAGARVPPGMRIARIGDLSEPSATSSTSSNTPLLLIDQNLRLHAFFRPDLGYPRTLPPADLGSVVWAGATGSLGNPWYLALRSDGTLVQWSASRATAPGYRPEDPRWSMIMLGSSVAGGITEKGALRAWKQAGPVEVFNVDSDGPWVTGDIGRNWGLVVDAGGTAKCCGLGTPLADGQREFPGIAKVSVSATVGSSAGVPPLTRAWLLHSDGTVRNAAGTASAPGAYTDISGTGVVQYELLALRTDGSIDARQNGVWRNIPGSYTSVELLDAGRTPFAVWSEDTDRDGEPDESQIARGELPDVNGDLVNDLVQASSVFADLDASGVADAVETLALTNRNDPTTTTWAYMNQPPNTRETWATAIRVAPGSEVADLAVLQCMYYQQLPPSYLPPTGATFHIWRDPNNDGDPVDAVELVSVPFAVRNKREVVGFPPVILGQPGDIVFAGYSWLRPASGGQALHAGMAADPAPAGTNADLLATSRFARRTWAASSRTPGATPTRMLRGTIDFLANANEARGAFEDYGIGSYRPMLSLGSTAALASDCDGNGVLDSLDLASTTFRPLVDADQNGRIDACEGDCDADGIPDLEEIVLGAEDCDADLVPDECQVPKRGAPDCDVDGVPDWCAPDDCNGNDVPDVCELAEGSADTNRNGVLDQCERDCDRDGVPDAIELANGSEPDCDSDGWIDRCQSDDCDGDGVSDLCEIAISGDCNENRIPDECDDASSDLWSDDNANGVLDQCEFRSSLDCDGNGIPDAEQFPDGVIDCDSDGVFDACEQNIFDCDADGTYDLCEIAAGEPDCNANGRPDACEGIADDCDSDGITDICELAGGAPDCDADGIPDDCQGGDSDSDGHLDWCEAIRCDLNLDDYVDSADLGLVLGAWGVTSGSPFDGDVTLDGIVNGADLGMVLTNWGPVIW